MSPADFASRIVAYCSVTDASVTSWGRTKAHNESVGGVLGSLHQVWLAVDVTYDLPVSIHEAEHLAASLGLMLIREVDHDHLQAKRE